MSTKLELETFAGATIQSWKDQATKAGLVLRAPSDVTDSGDYSTEGAIILERYCDKCAVGIKPL